MSHLKNEKKDEGNQDRKSDNKPLNPLNNSDWFKKILSWFIKLSLIGGIIFLLIWPNYPKYDEIKPSYAIVKNDDNGYYLDIFLPKGQNKKIYYANKDKNLNYDCCFAYYFQDDQQKTTYSFHGKPQGAREIEFKVVVEILDKSKNEKNLLIGGKKVEKPKSEDMWSLFQDWITFVTTNADYLPSPKPGIFYIILHILPSILIVYFLISSMISLSRISGGKKGNDLFGFGKSQTILAKSNVKFKDVAGIEEEKSELVEIVDYLKNPKKYKASGARSPKGVLLYGPPGTGKTLLAKAVAGEANVAFFQTSGASFDESLVGVGARRVRDLFLLAKY